MNIFENCKTQKDKGNVGEAYALAFLIKEGYTVSKPLNENQSYDFIIEKDNCLLKVQVKSTSVYKNNNWIVTLATSGGNKYNNTRKYFDKNKIDYIIIVVKSGGIFFLSTSDIENKTAIRVNEEKFKINYLNDYENNNQFKEKKINIEILKKDRKRNRPPYEILIQDTKSLGFSATGRKYGVSDNSIRKWIKFYEKHEHNDVVA